MSKEEEEYRLFSIDTI